MLVYDAFGSSTIPLETTVTRVVDEVLTLSNAVTIAAGTELQLVENNGTITSFSLTVQPDSRKTISLKSNKSFNKSISTNSSVTAEVTTSGSSTTLRALKVGIRGIVPGMRVYGENIVGTQSDEYGQYVTVQSVNVAANTFVVDEAQNLATETNVTSRYARPTSIPGYSASSNEDYAATAYNKISPKHVQAKIEDGNLIVEGYIEIQKLGIDSTINIYIDDFASTN